MPIVIADLPFALRPGRRLRLRLVQVNNLGTWRLLQYEFVIRKRLVQIQFHDVQSDVVLLLRPRNLDSPGEVYAIVLLIISVNRVGRDISLFVVEKLAVRQQVGATEHDLP